MSFNDLIDNPTPRCPCLLVLDTSGSMSGAPIQQLNAGVKQFIRALQDDDTAKHSVEVAIMVAGEMVEEVMPFTTASHIEQTITFEACGLTPLGEAVSRGLDMLEQRKAEYQQTGTSYYQPWLVVISDGAPTDDWLPAAARAKSLADNRKLISLPVGVDSADMDILGEFSNRPALKLNGLKFAQFFQWLSASMSRVSNLNVGDQVGLPPVDGWAAI